MFDTSQESPVKSPPVRMSESPTPCSGYGCRDALGGRSPASEPYTSLPTSIHLHTHSPVSISASTLKQMQRFVPGCPLDWAGVL